jgi:hypothetical protein
MLNPEDASCLRFARKQGWQSLGKRIWAVLYFGVFSFLSWKSNLATPAACYDWRCLNLTSNEARYQLGFELPEKAEGKSEPIFGLGQVRANSFG